MQDELLQLWPDEENVAACIKHEAETVDNAVFLAVHQPMQFLRREVGSQGGGQTLDEGDLLKEFLTDNLPEGRLILPIVGSSGVGKSHVIRWIDAQLERRDDRDRRHVIRIPKGMSLKGVLRLLLSDLEGPEYDRLRRALLEAREQLAPDLAAKHLVLNLRHRLETEAAAAAARIRNKQELPLDRLVKTYGHPNALPMFLGDSELERSHWLSTPDGSAGVMSKMAEQVTEEASGPEDTRKHEFTANDLRIPPDMVQNLNRTSGKFYLRLQNTASGDRFAEAADVLNLVLDKAKQDLLQLGDGSLTDLFRDVRAELYRDGKELVLLVEDLAVLSGMQGALLQVMITEAYRDGEQVLCTMRSALAYTEGYANVPETVLTRARSRWLIEDIPGDEERILKRVEQLVGSYLNAARLGQDRLRSEFGRAAGSKSWVPSMDHRDFEDETQALVRAFGVTSEGYPLFPFNRGSIRQLTIAGSTNSRGDLVFNPRAVINNVLSKVLPLRANFAQQRFPSAGFGTADLKSVEVVSEVSRKVPATDLDRVLKLLAYWGDQPSTVGHAAALPQAIYAAFSLPWPNWGVTPTTKAPSAAKSQSNSPRRQKQPSAERRGNPKEDGWLTALQEWSSGGTLGQVHAMQLRNWLARAALEHAPWSQLLYKCRGDKPFVSWLSKQVYIPRALGGQPNMTPGQAFFVVAQDSDMDDQVRRAQVVQSLMAAVRIHDIHESWAYDGAVSDAALYGALLSSQAANATQFVRANHHRLTVDSVPALAETLLVGARALGVDGAESRQQHRLISATLADAEEPTTLRPGPWAELVRAFLQHRSTMRGALLEQVGARQGSGATVHAIDAATLLAAVAVTAGHWELQSALPPGGQDRSYKRMQTAHRDLRASLGRTLEAEREDLISWHAATEEWLGDEIEKSTLIETLRDTVRTAKRATPLNYDDSALRQHINMLKDLALKGTLKQCARLQDAQDFGSILSALAGRPHAVVDSIRALMTEMDRFLETYGREALSIVEGMGEDAFQQGVDGIQEELVLIETAVQNIQEARS